MNDMMEGSKGIMIIFKRFPEDSHVQEDGKLAIIIGTWVEKPKIHNVCVVEEVRKIQVSMCLLGAINIECSNQGKSKVSENPHRYTQSPLKKVPSRLNTILTPKVQGISAINSTECHRHGCRGGDSRWQDVEALNGINSSLMNCSDGTHSIKDCKCEWNLGPSTLFCA